MLFFHRPLSGMSLFFCCPALANNCPACLPVLAVQYGGYVRIRDRLSQAEAAAKVGAAHLLLLDCGVWLARCGCAARLLGWPSLLLMEENSICHAQTHTFSMPPRHLDPLKALLFNSSTLAWPPVVPQTPEVQEQRREPMPPRIYGEQDR